MILVITVIIVALVFEYINGFHDTAISIATSVSTKILTPRQAVMLAATCNLAGALVGVSVATTIGKGLVDTDFITMRTIVCALVSAILWNLLTWWLGLPSSSSHALIGGLCGAALATAKGNWHVIRWSVTNPDTGKIEGLWHKVIVPMFTSPILGILLGFLIMGLLLFCLQKFTPRLINAVFGKLQLVSASWMGFSHGTNDAQ
ncbi:MAG: inorganic phosphate transporter, partial [Kiritimatiellae bacterium]|nr:inorganic phosphate transporter [Kiritimatiellia bacterium]